MHESAWEIPRANRIDLHGNAVGGNAGEAVGPNGDCMTAIQAANAAGALVTSLSGGGSNGPPAPAW